MGLTPCDVVRRLLEVKQQLALIAANLDNRSKKHVPPEGKNTQNMRLLQKHVYTTKNGVRKP